MSAQWKQVSFCTDPSSRAHCQLSAVASALYAFVNGLCAAAATEQSEFRLLHSSCYWPTLSLIIPANIDTACVVSHLYSPLPLPELSKERERGTDELQEKDILLFNESNKSSKFCFCVCV